MSIIPFNFENVAIRVEIVNDEPYFVAKDVCDVLELQNVSKAVSNLDDDERYNQKLDRGGSQILINESGLYSLILRSNKPQAKKFKKWVTSEVLPSIRKTGAYEIPKVLSPMEMMELQFKAHKELSQKVQVTNERLDTLEQTSALTSADCYAYQKAVEQKVWETLDKFKLDEKTYKPKLFSAIHIAIKKMYQVGSYKDLPHYKVEDLLSDVRSLTPIIKMN